jgi:hypothetical protein
MNGYLNQSTSKQSVQEGLTLMSAGGFACGWISVRLASKLFAL